MCFFKYSLSKWASGEDNDWFIDLFPGELGKMKSCSSNFFIIFCLITLERLIYQLSFSKLSLFTLACDPFSTLRPQEESQSGIALWGPFQ